MYNMHFNKQMEENKKENNVDTAAARAGALCAGVARAATPSSEVRGSSREELPCVRGQVAAESYPHPRSRSAGKRHPASEVRGGWEKPPRYPRPGQ